MKTAEQVLLAWHDANVERVRIQGEELGINAPGWDAASRAECKAWDELRARARALAEARDNPVDIEGVPV